jgi:hypothetical protein
VSEQSEVPVADLLVQPARVSRLVADLIDGRRVHDDAIDAESTPVIESPRPSDRLCPCQRHPIEYTGVTIPPWWDGDEPKPVLVCPTPAGDSVVEGASEGYLYVPPGETADPTNWRPVWAIEALLANRAEVPTPE